VHNDGHCFNRVEAQAAQVTLNTEGTRGSGIRWEVANAKQDANETPSKDINGDQNPNLLDMSLLPPNAMSLLQQLLASLSDKGKATEVEPQLKQGASGVEAKHDDVLESLVQGKARLNMENGKPPYCYRCLSRGHAKEECVAQLVCEVCDNTTHMKARCPVHKKAVKSFVMTYGYAVDGLVFFYIPHTAAPRSKEQSRAAVIKVVQGKGKWIVEEIGPNTFKTSFSSRGELQRMVEWRDVQSKDRKAVMIIEESVDGSFFKQALKHVWVQMTGLPEELRDYPTIWAIGTILGVTKEVDMKFTRALDRPWFQVLVLDVVIRDFICELHFKVEPELMNDNP
jgi:hypothetical protein